MTIAEAKRKKPKKTVASNVHVFGIIVTFVLCSFYHRTSEWPNNKGIKEKKD